MEKVGGQEVISRAGKRLLAKSISFRTNEFHFNIAYFRYGNGMMVVVVMVGLGVTGASCTFRVAPFPFLSLRKFSLEREKEEEGRLRLLHES